MNEVKKENNLLKIIAIIVLVVGIVIGGGFIAFGAFAGSKTKDVIDAATDTIKDVENSSNDVIDKATDIINDVSDNINNSGSGRTQEEIQADIDATQAQIDAVNAEISKLDSELDSMFGTSSTEEYMKKQQELVKKRDEQFELTEKMVDYKFELGQLNVSKNVDDKVTETIDQSSETTDTTDTTDKFQDDIEKGMIGFFKKVFSGNLFSGMVSAPFYMIGFSTLFITIIISVILFMIAKKENQ